MIVLEVRVKRKQGRFTVEAAFGGEETGVTALFGRSGAGKTSVINMVAGLARPDEGRVAVNGRLLFDSRQGVNLPPEKRGIGYVFQDGRLFPHLDVASNLAYGMRLTPPDRRYLDFERVVELLGIGHLLQRRPALLSGGEKQRVAIGRALLTSPSLLLMDEPLASLDGERKAEVLPFVHRLSRELSVPILYVSHSLDEILNLADFLVVLEGGRVVDEGSLEEVTSRLDPQAFPGIAGDGAVIPTVVAGHDEAGGLTHLSFPGGVLRAPRMDLPPGREVRVRIRARNVALALVPPKRTSIRNIFPCTVESVAQAPGGLVDARVDIGCPLTARITRHAARDLGIRPGRRMYALVKSIAVSRGDAGGNGRD